MILLLLNKIKKQNQALKIVNIVIFSGILIFGLLLASQAVLAAAKGNCECGDPATDTCHNCYGYEGIPVGDCPFGTWYSVPTGKCASGWQCTPCGGGGNGGDVCGSCIPDSCATEVASGPIEEKFALNSLTANPLKNDGFQEPNKADRELKGLAQISFSAQKLIAAVFIQIKNFFQFLKVI